MTWGAALGSVAALASTALIVTVRCENRAAETPPITKPRPVPDRDFEGVVTTGRGGGSPRVGTTRQSGVGGRATAATDRASVVTSQQVSAGPGDASPKSPVFSESAALRDLLARLDGGRAGSTDVNRHLIHCLSVGGPHALRADLAAMLVRSGSDVARPQPAGLKLLLAACAHSEGDLVGARSELVGWARALSPVPSALYSDGTAIHPAWPLARELAPIGWTVGSGDTASRDGSPSSARLLWLRLAGAHSDWRPEAFASWLDREARESPGPDESAASALAAALLGYANLVRWDSQTQLIEWVRGGVDPPMDRASDVDALRAEHGMLVAGRRAHSHVESHGRWFLKRFLVERDWGADAAEVEDLVEKGRVLLRSGDGGR